jgi:acetyl esterase/lipase
VVKKKNITYDAEHNLHLDVYVPRWKKTENVMLYAHGGNWENGSKRIYRFLGRGMARKGITTVIFNYRLYPDTNFFGMAADAAAAIAWTNKNISRFGADPERIFLSGHSAGAQVVAITGMDDRYTKAALGKNPVKGIILIDPFGLDAYTGLKKGEDYKRDLYLTVFTKDPDNWKLGSPQWNLRKGIPPILIFLGGDTYSGIKEDVNLFYPELKKVQPDAKLVEVPGKKHVAMIFSFLNPRYRGYKEIISFMKK